MVSGHSGSVPSLPGQSDPEGKIAKVCVEKLEKSIAKKCAPLVVLEVAFPGSNLGGSLTALRDYVDYMVDCEVCLALNVIDGVRRDCDLFDDGTANGTCL